MRKLAPWLALLVAALIGWRIVSSHLRNDGAVRQQIADTEARVTARNRVIAALASQVPKVDTLFRADKQAVASWAQRYQRLRDSLFANGEHGTITDPVILAADSTVAACSKALATCDSAIAVRDLILAHKDTLLWATDSLLRLERKRRGGFKVLGIPLGCAVGGVASPRGIAPGVGCGIRVGP